MVATGVPWFTCGLVLYSCVAHVRNLLYSQVPTGILLDILSTWLSFNCIIISCVWLCNAMMFNDIPLLRINPLCWKDDCVVFFIVSFLRYWLGWNFFSFGAKGISVPGCAIQPSVAPFKGEQPWRSAPRSCFPWPKGSMMSFALSETLFLPLKGFCHCLDSCLQDLIPFLVPIFLQLFAD